MKALRVILIILVVIVGGYSIWMATIDPEYRVERSEIINADPDKVYGVVSDFESWSNWSAWHKMDPDMEITYGDQSAGVGASYSWKGEKAGAGTQTITDGVPGESMSTHIAFEGMGEADGSWQLEQVEPGVTKVTWAFMGESPFFFRAMNLAMDEAVGKDFESGLSNLKEYVESLPDAAPEVAVERVQLESVPYYGIKTEMAISDMNSDFFGQGYGEIMTYLGPDAQANMLMAPMALYYDWDEANNRTVVEPAIAANSDKPGNDRVKKNMSYAGPALKAVNKGSYETIGNVHEALEAYMKANNLSWPEGGAAMEVYVTDPMAEPDTAKWVTEIYYPYVEADQTAE